MPKINLRLSDEEHAELERWAFDSQRSIQKEIIFRLFANGQLPERELPAKTGVAAASRSGQGALDGASSSARSGSCPMNPPRGTKCKSCGKVHG